MSLSADVRALMERMFPAGSPLLEHLLRGVRLQWLVYTTSSRGVAVQLDGYLGQVQRAAAVVGDHFDMETILGRPSFSGRGRRIWVLEIIGRKASTRP